MKGKKRKTKSFFINIFLVSAILGIMIWIGMEEYKDKSIQDEKTSNYNTQFLQQEGLEEKKIEIKEGILSYPQEPVIEEYKGYPVSAKLEIPAIELETYVLQKYSIKALNVSVTKFWGANPNEIGNFCIAGHNFQNKNMFRNLRKLKVGDNLFIADNKIGKVEYEIYDLYKVLPDDVNCLSQETNGKREVTLITCTTDSQKRIIVKAREVE